MSSYVKVLSLIIPRSKFLLGSCVFLVRLIRWSVKRNIKLAYFLSFAFHSWFWMGNWIFYYLTFGGYAAVAVLDSGAYMAGLLFEIPTGVFADKVGKKKALMIAFLCAGLGNILMGFSTSFWMMALSLWILVNGGGAFYSGTMDALLYDSLKVLKLEDQYDKKIGKLNAFRLWSMAVCAVIGGFAYTLSPSLPLILNGIVTLIGFVACFWLVEPPIDTDKYKITSFFEQNTLGIKTLFTGDYMKRLSLFLIATGSLCIVIYNLLDDLLAVEYGYSPMSISILFAIACLIAGFASMYFPHIKIKWDTRKTLIISMVLMAVALMISPFIGMLVSGGVLMFRVILEVVFENVSSVAINKKIESNIRATTLSSLSLLQSVPYAIGGSFVGVAVLAAGGARNFALYFGLVLVIVAVVLGVRLPRSTDS